MKRKITLSLITSVCLFFAGGVSIARDNPLDDARSEDKNRALNEIVSSMRGEGFYKIKEEVNTSASNFFMEHKAAFGLTNHDEMKVLKVNTDDLGFSHYRFEQYYKGVKIEAMQMIAHERNGRVEIVNGEMVNLQSMNVVPPLTESAALNAAMAHIGADSYMWENEGAENALKQIKKDPSASWYPKAELVILTKEFLGEGFRNNRLAYKLDIYATSPESYKDVYVDAVSGKVVLELNRLYTENVPGQAETLWEGKVNFTTDHFEGGFRLNLVDYRGGEADILTLNANNTQPINFDAVTDFVDDDNYWDNVNPQLDEVAPGFHHSAHKTYDYYYDKHGRYSIDDNGQDMIGYMHVGVDWFNASWNGQFMQFGDGGGGSLTTISVVSHEFSHGVTGSSAGLIYQAESGALNESFSDIFGVSVEFFALPDRPRDEVWDIGIRSLKDPKSYGDPDTYFGENWAPLNGGDFGGVHTNSGVQNFWFYLLTEGGSGTNDNNDFYTVWGLGDDDAQAIAYRNLTVYLTPNSGYAQARAGSLRAAEDLFGACSAQYSSVADAWYAVGVGGGLEAGDFTVASVSAPSTQCGFTNDEKITIGLKYLGACDEIDAGEIIDISFVVDGQPVVNENYVLAENMKSGDVVQYTSVTGFDLTNAGNHEIEVSISYAGDNNAINDTYNVIVTNTKEGEDDDIGVVAVLVPATNCDGLSNMESVMIEIRNFGCKILTQGTSIPVRYTVNGGPAVEEDFVLTADLVGSSNTTYTFTTTSDFSVAGTYSIEAYTASVDDPDNANDLAQLSIVAGVIPAGFTEDFENGSGGWIHAALSGSDVWELGTPAQFELNSAHSGDNAWMTDLDGNHPDQSEMVLVSPCYDISDLTHPSISFWLHFQIEVNWDGMILEYSTDGSQTWSRVEVDGYNSNISLGGLLSQPWFSGTNVDWTEYVVYMPYLLDASVVSFRFRYASDEAVNDEGAAIDDFYVGNLQVPDRDLELTKILSPANGCGLTDSEPLRIEVMNKGLLEDNFVFDVTYNFNNEGEVQVSDPALMIDNLPYGETREVVVPGVMLDMSAEGTYTLDVKIAAVDDGNGANDAIMGAEVMNSPQTVLPYAQNFEGINNDDLVAEFPENWFVIKTEESVGWFDGTAALLSSDSWTIPPLDGDLDNLIMASNDDACFCDMSNDRLVMPLLNLSANVSAKLEFQVSDNKCL